MLRRGTHRIAIALALAAALLAPAASPAAQLHGTAHASPWLLNLDALRTWARLWLGLAGAPAHQKSACDAGAHIDPNGRTICQSTAGAPSDAGLQIDPNGLQAPNSPTGATSDAGLHIDPDG